MIFGYKQISILDFGKFRIFDLVEILTILFSLFFIFLKLLLATLSLLNISTNINKYFTNIIIIFLSIKVNNLVILLKS